MELAHCQIARQELLMNATKEAHKVTDKDPHAFESVDMHFADAIAVVIPRPFTLGVTNGGVRTGKVVIAAPFIGINMGIIQGKVLQMRLEGFSISMANHHPPPP